MTASLFCDTCGAAITVQATCCPACGSDIDQSSAPSAGAFVPGHLLAGRYRLVDQIGQGGFGLLYKARDTARHNRPVAIKQINMASLSTQEKIEATDSYNREVMYLSKLQHKSLPRFYDHFTDPDHWYVVMEYIEGETLEDILQKTPGGRLPLEQVIDIGCTLCEVLSYLHQQNPPVIFRDVKPANIMMTSRGRLYLVDFGIARSYRPGKANDTGALGSPGYAAPEQYGRAQTTRQTDIYGLGATLQTLITGKEPLELTIDGMPADLYLPRRLQYLLGWMMEREASKRPKNVEEVKRYLRRLRGITTGSKIRLALAGIGAVALLSFFSTNSGFMHSMYWGFCLALYLLVIVPYMSWLLYTIIKTPGGMDAKEIWLELRKRLINSCFWAMLTTLGVACLYVLPQLSPGAGVLIRMFEVGLLALLGLGVVIAAFIGGCLAVIFIVERAIKFINQAIKSLLQKKSGSRAASPARAASQQVQIQQIRKHP